MWIKSGISIYTYLFLLQVRKWVLASIINPSTIYESPSRPSGVGYGLRTVDFFFFFWQELDTWKPTRQGLLFLTWTTWSKPAVGPENLPIFLCYCQLKRMVLFQWTSESAQSNNNFPQIFPLTLRETSQHRSDPLSHALLTHC